MSGLATFDVTLYLMARGIPLPIGTEVVFVETILSKDIVRYTVRHPDLPEVAGNKIPHVLPRVTSHVDDFGNEYKTWDWGRELSET